MLPWCLIVGVMCHYDLKRFMCINTTHLKSSQHYCVQVSINITLLNLLIFPCNVPLNVKKVISAVGHSWVVTLALIKLDIPIYLHYILLIILICFSLPSKTSTQPKERYVFHNMDKEIYFEAAFIGL